MFFNCSIGRLLWQRTQTDSRFTFFSRFRMAENDPLDFLSGYYAMPYARAGPYIIGMLLGYILFNNRDKRIILNKVRI